MGSEFDSQKAPKSKRAKRPHPSSTKRSGLRNALRRRAFVETLERRELFAISFEFNFLNDIPNFGFNDPVQGATRRQALQTAAANFGSFFDHTATIEVDVNNLNIANGTGATAGGEFTTTLNSGFIMNVPQEKILTGIDQNGNDSDGHLSFNWGAINTTPAEFGLDLQFNEVDFNSIIYHELTHLIGFLSVIDQNGNDLFGTAPGQPGVWTSFDKFLSDSAGNPIINQTTHTLNTTLYNQQKTNGSNVNQGIFFNGPIARAANGGNPVPIHSPAPFAPGSSLSHTRINAPTVTDENSLLVFSISTGPISRRWNALEIAMLKDLGFSINALPTGISFEASSGNTTVSESGTSDTFLVRLDSRPTSNVVLNVTSTNPNEAIVDKSTLTFTPTNWGNVQTITVTGVNDGLADGNQNVSIQLSVVDASSNDAYDPVADVLVPVTVNDIGAAPKIGNRIFHDLNRNGIQDANEPGMNQVTVRLTGPGNAPTREVVTNAQGDYSFPIFTSGNYTLQVVPPANFGFSPQNAGNDDTLDSDVGADGSLILNNLNLATDDFSIDAGLIEEVPNQIVVTTADDEFDTLNNDLNDISLREALFLAEVSPGHDTIIFAPALQGTQINLSLTGDTTFGPTALRIGSEVTIQGPIEITRNTSLSDLRLFYVTTVGNITFDKVTLSNGEAIGGNGGSSGSGGGGGGAGLGGAIFNQGTVSIIASTLNNNTARGGNGGNSKVGGLGQGGGGGGGLEGNGNNPNNNFGANGNSGGGTGGNKVTGSGQVVTGGDGSSTSVFGAGGGGGGFGQNTNLSGFSAGGLGGSAGFGGGGGGVGQASGGTFAARPESTAGFGGGYGGGEGGGGGGGLGGAIFNDGGTLSVFNSTLSNNVARGGNAGTGGEGFPGGQGGQGLGGAIFNRDGTVTVRQSTLAENFAQVGSGDNTTAEGTAIYNLQSNGTASVALFNSILASSDFRSDARNDGGTITGGGNLIEVAGNFPTNIIVSSSNARLGPLAANGGPTRTHALLANSPAINAGLDAEMGITIADQRGTPFARKIGTQVDIGAYEFFPISGLIVSTLTDELDADLSDGDLSLREAIALANSTTTADVITFAPNLTGTLQLTLGQLVIDQSLTITGNGATQTIIDANQLSRVMKINATATSVSLNALTLKNGRTTGNQEFGAGIFSQATDSLSIVDSIITGNEAAGTGANGGGIRVNQGTLNITRSTISNNRASGANSDGGGIDLRNGQLVLTDSTITGNQATARGGGITVDTGSLTILNSTLDHNTSVDRGGAAFVDTTTTITVINSTISDNQATGNVGGFGAGLASIMGNINLVHATIADNTAAKNGGGIFSAFGSLMADNSIIANNTGQQGQPEFSLSFLASISLRFTLIGNNAGTDLAPVDVPGPSGSLIGTADTPINPRLVALADNGGPTRTRALLADSPAFNRGNAALSLGLNDVPLVNDQRGNGFARLVSDTVDMGAFERLPTFGISVAATDGTTIVNESGTTDSFLVSLTAQPTSDVILMILIGDATEVGADQVTLTFNANNWNQPQTVVVTGNDDAFADGDQVTSITIRVDDAASDDNYDPLEDKVINVTTVDNDLAGLAVVESNGATQVIEAGGTDTITVALSAQPATDVVLNLSLDQTAHASISASTLTFTTANWNIPQTVTVTGKSDSIQNGDQNIALTLSVNDNQSDNAFDNVADRNVAITVKETQLDLGDAPAPYPTLIANQGASHQAAGPRLGPTRDIEGDGQPNASATGDDAAAGYVSLARIPVNADRRINETALGDLNGDGKLDLVLPVTGTSDSIMIRLGNGDGTFQAASEITLATGSNPISIVLDDFNGDQRLDAAVANFGSNDVSLLLGKGDGTFESLVKIGLNSNPASVAFGLNQIISDDLNNDNVRDLLVVGFISDDVSILIGKGDGTFQNAQNFPSFPLANAFGGGSTTMVTHDFDGDGFLDIAVANFANDSITIMINDGTGAFPQNRVVEQLLNPGGNPGELRSGALALADFNKDGFIDIITANANGTLTPLFGNGTTQFAAQTRVTLPGNPSLASILHRDLNGDGFLDLVLTDQQPVAQAPGGPATGSVILLFGQGNGSFGPPTKLTSGLQNTDAPFRLALEDIDANGSTEILTDVGSGVAIFTTAKGDEDGVQFPAGAIGSSAQGSVTIDLQNANNAANKLDAWIDFNRDGDWNDPGEQIFTSFDLGTANGTQTLTFNVPASTVSGTSFARFRLSSAGGLTPTGFAVDGEVEDYRVTLQTPAANLDFGDAPSAAQSGLPNSYPTTLAQDGPRHTKGPLFLGSSVDAEVNGVPDAQAGQGASGGDDHNGTDDEDGVSFLTTLLRSNTRAHGASFQIVASQAGKLDTWIDFDRSGSFDGPEHLGGGTSIDLVAGVNLIPFTIPAGASSGLTGARFRFSSAGGLAPTGAASDGEVEDYMVTLINGDLAQDVTVNMGSGTTVISDENNTLVIKVGSVEIFRAANSAINSFRMVGTSSDDTLRLNGLPIKASGANLRSIDGNSIPFSWDAAAGNDRLIIDGSVDTFDLTQLSSDALQNIETIDLTPVGATNLILDVNHLPSSGSNTPTTIIAGTGDTFTFDADWKIVGVEVTNNRLVRKAARLNAAVNLVTPAEWNNPINGLDVDGNGSVQALDALLVINVLNAQSLIDASGNLPDAKTQNPLPTAFFDVDGDNKVLPLDALLVINELNRTGSSEPSDDFFAAVDEFFDEYGRRKNRR